jgi:hypothetical protein
MAVRKLDKKEWRTFLDGVSKALEGKQAEIEVDSLALGSQTQAKSLPLLGLVYDPNDDIVEVALEGLDHMVQKPREIYVDTGAGGLMSLEIVDADGGKQIVKLTDPLKVPDLGP